MPTTKAKSKKTVHKKIKTLLHNYFGKEGVAEDVTGLYAKKKMSPKEYVSLISGAYGQSPYDLKYSIHPENSPHSQNEKYNDLAIKKLHDHKKAVGPDTYHELDSSGHIDNILTNYPVSEEMIKKIIKNPRAYGLADSESLSSALKNQKSVSKDVLMRLAHDPESAVGNLISHPNADRDVAQAMIKAKPDRISTSQMKHMLSTMKHQDPSKRMLESSDVEDLLLGQRSKFSGPDSSYRSYPRGEPSDLTNEMLGAIAPDKKEDGSIGYDKRTEIIDKLLGIHGGKNANDLDEVDHPDHFAYDNWIQGREAGKSHQREAIAGSKFLSPHQIDHIKRHGTGSEKYALFKNPNIDPKHAAEMYENWASDDDNKGYALDDLKEGIKEDHPYEDMTDDLRDEAEEQVREDNPLSDMTDNWDDDDWVNRREFTTQYQEDNPEAPEEDLNEAYDKEVKAAQEDPPEWVWEKYDEWNNDAVYDKMRDLYSDKMDDDPHFNEEFLPEHLHGKLPGVEEAKAKARERKAIAAQEKATEQEKKAQPYLNANMPKRDNTHAYGDQQHHIEMAKRVADANGGAVDVGQLHKMFPNLKDKWKGIFGSKGKISSQELDQKLQELPKTPYAISYQPWNKHQMQNVNNQDQVVVRLDHSPESIAPLKQDPETFNTFSKIQDVSQRSGHPTNPNTIAWARVDTSNPKHWMIDEVQSDFGSAARDYLDDNGKGDEAKHVDKIIDYHKNWREALINKVLHLAQSNGADKVSTHSPESKAAHTGADKVHSVYKDSYQKVPRSMGFRSSAAAELPLSENGMETFMSAKSGTPVENLLQNHVEAMDEHAKMWNRHADLADNPVEDRFADAHVKLANHHAKMYKEHQKKLSNLDPSHELRNAKAAFSYMNHLERNNQFGLDEQGGKRDQAISAAKGVTDDKHELPIYGFDSALNEAPEVVQAHPGHTFDLNPQITKKHLEEVTDLMKKEISQSSRTKIAMTLRTIQENEEMIQQLQQSNPDAYQAVNSMVQALVKLFQDKTGETVDALMHELEIKEQLEEQQEQMQAQQPQQEQGQEQQAPPQGAEESSGVGGPRVDQPVHGAKMVYAPGAIRRYTSQDERIKGQDGDWSSFKGGLEESTQGQSNE